jgi:hypothetical protein
VSEEGLPHTQVLLWVSGESLRAAFEHVVLAAYHCRYDWQDHQVKDIHGGMFYPTRVASPQGILIPFTPQESLVVYCSVRGHHLRTHHGWSLWYVRKPSIRI